MEVSSAANGSGNNKRIRSEAVLEQPEAKKTKKELDITDIFGSEEEDDDKKEEEQKTKKKEEAVRARKEEKRKRDEEMKKKKQEDDKASALHGLKNYMSVKNVPRLPPVTKDFFDFEECDCWGEDGDISCKDCVMNCDLTVPDGTILAAKGDHLSLIEWMPSMGRADFTVGKGKERRVYTYKLVADLVPDGFYTPSDILQSM